MGRCLPIVLSLLVAAAAAPRAAALTADEVVVVANADLPDSMAIARFYAQQRGIDPSHIIALKTIPNYHIPRKLYDSQIAEPLRTAMIERKLVGKVRCLVTVWGVPVRVLAPEDPTAEVMAAEATKAHYRLATDYELLATVCKKFPTPRTGGLAPLGELFGSQAPPVEPLPKWEALLADVDTLLELKLAEFRKLTDPTERQIAWRQLMALHMDIHGLAGLIKFVEDAGMGDSPSVKVLRGKLADARAELQQLQAAPPGPDSARELLAAAQKVDGAVAAGAIAMRHKPSSSILAAGDAAVDSELAMLWWPDVPATTQIPNPLFAHWRATEAAKDQLLPPVMMTARLDGPSRDDILRLIADSIAVEQTGLSGTFYIDAGGLDRARQYDATFRALNRFLRSNTKLKVVFDEARAVFQPDTCPDSALYVGWYSLQKYIPAFEWARGAVGWHVASFEAMHLRDPNSAEWCPKMIQNGVVATIGAVDEPTLMTFPRPDEFFPLLLTGKYTLAECYWRTCPVVSWRVLLIGDPLYNPFKASPQVAPQALASGLAPPPGWASGQPWRPTSFVTSAPR